MPLYTYVCNKCGKAFEKLVGMTADEGELTCPDCGSDDVIKDSFNRTSNPSSYTYKGQSIENVKMNFGK